MQTESLAEAQRLLVKALNWKGIKTCVTSQYTVMCDGVECSFALSFMPGNRRTLISHNVTVSEKHRGRGIGTAANRLRENAARYAGVTLILATVRDDNAPEIRVLEKCEWKRLTQNT